MAQWGDCKISRIPPFNAIIIIIIIIIKITFKIVRSLIAIFIIIIIIIKITFKILRSLQTWVKMNNGLFWDEQFCGEKIVISRTVFRHERWDKWSSGKGHLSRQGNWIMCMFACQQRAERRDWRGARGVSLCVCVCVCVCMCVCVCVYRGASYPECARIPVQYTSTKGNFGMETFCFWYFPACQYCVLCGQPLWFLGESMI